LAKVRTTWG